MNPKVKGLLGWLLRLGISALLLAWLWHKPKIHDALLQLGPQSLLWAGLGAGLYLASFALNAYKWKLILDAMGHRVPYGRLLLVTYVGLFGNLFLPTAVGGDVVRVGVMAAYDVPASIGTLSVLMQRVTGFVALLVIGVVGLLVSGELHDPVPRGVLVGLSLLLAAALAVLGLAYRLERRLDASERLPEGLRAPLRRIGEGLAALGRDPRAMSRILAWSFVFQLCHVGIGWLLAGPAGCVVPARHYFWLVPVGSAAGMVPVGLGGIGAREHVFNTLLRPVLGDQGVVWQVLWDTMVLLAALPGGLLLAGLRRQTDNTPPVASGGTS